MKFEAKTFACQYGDLNDLAVQVDGKKLLLDPTVHSNALVQNWQFPSKDGNSLNVSWERYDAYHAAPQVNFTASTPFTQHQSSKAVLDDCVPSCTIQHCYEVQ